ncbi:MAG TPA: hypothetical protein VGD66_00270 [Allosphingosinicella sp.]|jgi:hypothetical protein
MIQFIDTTPDITEDLLAAVRAGLSWPRDVDGRVDISGRKEGRLVFRGLHFKHDFIADAATLTSLTFESCVFDKPLYVRNSQIGGDISLHDCRFAAAPPPSGGGELRSLDLRGTIVNGSIALSKSELLGTCRLDRAVVRGNLAIRGGCRIVGTTNFTRTSVDSQLELSGVEFGEIVFSGSTLGSLWIGSREAVSCTGLYATDIEVRTYARLSRFSALASPGGARGANRLHLEEPGTIAFRSCRFGSLFSTWLVKRYGETENGWQDDNRVVAGKAFLFTDCKVKGELALSRLRVGTAEPERALDSLGLPILATGGDDGGKAWGHVRLDRTVVDGAFLILSPISVAHRFELSGAVRRRAKDEIRPDAMAPKYRAHMRSLSMRDFKASYMDVSGLSLHACGKDDLDAAIDGCLVGDRLEVTSSVTTYAWLHRDGDGSSSAGPARRIRAYAEVPGAVRLRGARIGELRLAAESFGHSVDCLAHKDGVVLELATIDQLRVPPRGSPPDCAHPNAFPVPLDLAGVTVRHWNFDEDVNAEGSGDIDDYLDFLDNDEKLHREVYRSISASLRNVGRDRDAEKMLYVEETRARWERHHPGDMWPPFPRAGRRGARPLTLGARLKAAGFHPIEWVDRWLLGYRRNPIVLLWVIIGLFAFSTLFVSSRPANFELSQSARLVVENQRPMQNDAAGIDAGASGPNPRPSHWGLWNAVRISARYHIPIIPVLVEDEYVASNDEQLDFGLPFAEKWDWKSARHQGSARRQGKVWFTAEDWFAIMSLLNWIMWPLLLTFTFRRALRADGAASA